MLYLLDANVLIDANRDYYPIGRVPEFWAWLVHQGSEGLVQVPVEVYEEITVGKDDLARWAKDADVKESLLFDEEADPDFVSGVVDGAYAEDLTDAEIQLLGRDPFLLSYALVDPHERCVVTTENSKPSWGRAKRKVPDACKGLGLSCRNTFQFLRELNFRTGWDKS